MPRFALRSFPHAAFVSALLTASGVSAADWHACTHPEWLETFGFSHFLVADALIREFGQGEGVTCDEMSGAYVAALAASCDRAARFSEDAWAEIQSTESGMQPLPCR